jgi:hypothetical protein
MTTGGPVEGMYATVWQAACRGGSRPWPLQWQAAAGEPEVEDRAPGAGAEPALVGLDGNGIWIRRGVQLTAEAQASSELEGNADEAPIQVQNECHEKVKSQSGRQLKKNG